MQRKTVFLTYILILLLSCVGVSIQFIRPVRAATTWTVDDDGPADFSSIQEAINVASDGDTILVAAGTYRPITTRLEIRKSLTLLGQNPNTTKIEGFFYVQANDVRISGFTVGANPWTPMGIYYHGPIMAGYDGACDKGVLDNNVFLGVGWYEFNSPEMAGVHIFGSGWLVYGNRILPLDPISYFFYEWIGLEIVGTDNTIVNNTIDGNESYPITGILDLRRGSNTIYHNNFVNCPMKINIWMSSNVWDDGYPYGGNYWSDYTGVDSNNDGIGDKPYVIDADNQDNYPLMNPWTPTETMVKVKGKDYPVTIVSNTTIEQIVATSNTLHFKSSGSTGETGYILVIFPMVNTTEMKVFIDGQKLTPPPFPVIKSNWTHYFIYFEFTLSTHDIALQFAPLAPPIPVGGVWVPIDKFELLAPWISLTSLLIVVTASIVYVKHRKKK